MSRRALVLCVCLLGVAAGVFSIHVAQKEPAFSYAGASAVGAIALLGTGWALIGCGLASTSRRPERRFGALLSTAGFAWFVLEWNNPDVGSSLAFTVGLCFYAACPPLVGHAVLAYPRRRLRSRVEQGVLAVAYAGSLFVVGVVPALFFDPQAQGCSQCPSNLLLISDRGRLAEDLTRAGLYVGMVWGLAFAVLALSRLGQSTYAVRPVLAAGAAYFGFVTAMFAVSADRGFLSPTSAERRLWLGQAATLAGIALGVAWARLRARHARAEVARLVALPVETAPTGGLRDMLAGILGDPDLVLAYSVGEPERLVNAEGRSVDLSPRLEQTSLIREGQAVAVLAHRPGLLQDPQLVEEVTAAARLALENERLQAEVRARVDELRRSRTRIVEAGDAERRRLERNLHDGAQQRLVALSLSLSLLRSRLATDGDASPFPRLAEADAELRTAIAELRQVAHGLFPAVLADEGFAAAVSALSEETRVPIHIRRLPDGRCASGAETAAYTVVAEVARAATSGLTVDAKRATGVLMVEVETRVGSLDLVELEDRVGAVGGHLSFERAPDGTARIRAEIPCAS
jgi:signal transduction histidine kinase